MADYQIDYESLPDDVLMEIAVAKKQKILDGQSSIEAPTDNDLRPSKYASMDYYLQDVSKRKGDLPEDTLEDKTKRQEWLSQIQDRNTELDGYKDWGDTLKTFELLSDYAGGGVGGTVGGKLGLMTGPLAVGAAPTLLATGATAGAALSRNAYRFIAERLFGEAPTGFWEEESPEGLAVETGLNLALPVAGRALKEIPISAFGLKNTAAKLQEEPYQIAQELAKSKGTLGRTNSIRDSSLESINDQIRAAADDRTIKGTLGLAEGQTAANKAAYTQFDTYSEEVLKSKPIREAKNVEEALELTSLEKEAAYQTKMKGAQELSNKGVAISADDILSSSNSIFDKINIASESGDKLTAKTLEKEYSNLLNNRINKDADAVDVVKILEAINQRRKSLKEFTDPSINKGRDILDNKATLDALDDFQGALMESLRKKASGIDGGEQLIKSIEDANKQYGAMSYLERVLKDKDYGIATGFADKSSGKMIQNAGQESVVNNSRPRDLSGYAYDKILDSAEGRTVGVENNNQLFKQSLNASEKTLANLKNLMKLRDLNQSSPISELNLGSSTSGFTNPYKIASGRLATEQVLDSTLLSEASAEEYQQIKNLFNGVDQQQPQLISRNPVINDTSFVDELNSMVVNTYGRSKPSDDLAKELYKAIENKDSHFIETTLAKYTQAFPDIFEQGDTVFGRVFEPQAQERIISKIKAGVARGEYPRSFLARQLSAFNDKNDLRLIDPKKYTQQTSTNVVNEPVRFGNSTMPRRELY